MGDATKEEAAWRAFETVAGAEADLYLAKHRYDRMVVLLRRLEHIPMPYTIPTCPVCREYVHSPHKPGCELDALLTEVGREG